MANKVLFTMACCGFFLMQKASCSSIIDELKIDRSSPTAFASTVIANPKDKVVTMISEELEWDAIAQESKEEKAKSYIYSFFLNHNSYDLERFLTKIGISTSLIPSYDEYYFTDKNEKKEMEKNLEEQINLLSKNL